VSLAPYATDNFISACPVEFLVSFVRYVCLKYLSFWASKSNNIFQVYKQDRGFESYDSHQLYRHSLLRSLGDGRRILLRVNRGLHKDNSQFRFSNTL